MNAIERIEEFDCGGQWWVYARTALPAVGAAIWLLLTPSPEEVLENYLNPKNGRGGSRRGRRARRRWRAGGSGRRRLYFGNLIPDIDEEIARRIPGGRLVRGRRVGPGEWLFWTGIDAVDRVLWYWLLWEASQEFLTTWQSELLESGACRTDAEFYFNGQYSQENNQLTATFFDEEDDIFVGARFGFDKPSGGAVQCASRKGFTGRIAISNKMVFETIGTSGSGDVQIQRTVKIGYMDDSFAILLQQTDGLKWEGEETIFFDDMESSVEVENMRILETTYTRVSGSVTGSVLNVKCFGDITFAGKEGNHE